MTSRLASETTRITLEGQSFELVPSLRAALTLARRYGTYSDLIGKIAEGNIQAIADAIEAGTGTAVISRLLRAVATTGVLRVISILQPASIDFVISLAGPAAENDGTATTGAPITFEAFHESLFEIATGFLGWSPNDAWSATPAEILAAHKGRMAMLRMIFGSSDSTDQAKPRDDLTLDQKARAYFAGRGTTVIKRKAA